jgi:hypothetical protein
MAAFRQTSGTGCGAFITLSNRSIALKLRNSNQLKLQFLGAIYRKLAYLDFIFTQSHKYINIYFLEEQKKK